MKMKTDTSTFIFVTLVIISGLIGIGEAQFATKQDIADLQVQVNQCLANAAKAQSDANFNYNQILAIIQREEKRHNDTQAEILVLLTRINALQTSVTGLQTRMTTAEANINYLLGLTAALEESVDKLLVNNEIWLHNFKTIKNIFQNGLKFKGNINYRYPTAIATIVRRERPATASVSSSSTRSETAAAAAAGVKRQPSQRQPVRSERQDKTA